MVADHRWMTSLHLTQPAIAAAYPCVPGYLNTASYGLPPRASSAALHAATDAWSRGLLDPADMDPVVDRMRAAYATLVRADAAEVTLAGSVSQVVGMVAASLPDGAKVLAVRNDFASVLFPFLSDPRLAVTLVELDDLVNAIRPGIDLVAVSAVQSCDGRVADLTGIALAAQAAGVKTLIDVSHAAGWLPMHARDFDVVVAAAYKWLTAPRGIALAAIHPRATWIRAVNASWYGADEPWSSLYGPNLNPSVTARRFDTSPPWQLVEAGAIALETLASADLHRTHAYVVGLANAFRSRIGLPDGDSPIVSVDGADADALTAAGVTVAARNGKARLSFYVYNTMADVEAAASAVGSKVLANA